MSAGISPEHICVGQVFVGLPSMVKCQEQVCALPVNNFLKNTNYPDIGQQTAGQ